MEQLADKKEEQAREERRREKLEKELKAVKAEINTAKQKETSLLDDLSKAETVQAQQRTQLREIKVSQSEHEDNYIIEKQKHTALTKTTKIRSSFARIFDSSKRN